MIINKGISSLESQSTKRKIHHAKLMISKISTNDGSNNKSYNQQWLTKVYTNFLQGNRFLGILT